MSAKRFTRKYFDTSGLSKFDAGESIVARGLYTMASPVVGVIGHSVKPFSRSNKPKEDKPNIYDDAMTMGGQDVSNPSVPISTRFDAMGGGQGSQKKATCMAFCVSTKGTDKRGLKYCEKSCKGLN